MVMVFAIYLHVLIRLCLEIIPPCVLPHRTLHLHGVVVVTVLALAMRVMIMTLSMLVRLSIDNFTTLVLDLSLKLHGYRNLSIILMVMNRSLKLTKIRKP